MKASPQRAVGALVVLVLTIAGMPAAPSAAAADINATDLFNGKDLDGWRLRHPKATNSKWSVVGAVKLAEGMPERFAAEKGTGILLNGDDGRGVDLLTEADHGDCELLLEFNVAKASNSGVYLQGQYEVQILDSFGKKDTELKFGDCGGIYNTAAPKTNVSKAPGEWQRFEIVFQAPRFGTDGKKTANAKFIKVILNGVTIHENVEVEKPTTASLGGAEKPKGPLMLQGDHGPVAFRNLRIKHAN